MPNFLSGLFTTKEAPAALETKKVTGTDGLGRTVADVTWGSRAAIYQGQDKNDLLKDGYSANAVSYSIIDFILTTAKTTKWAVYSLTAEDKTAAELPNHELSKVLYRPNPLQSWTEFKEETQGQYLLTGNAFIWKNATARGKVVELWVLPHDTEVMGGNEMNKPTGYRVPKGAGEYDEYPADKVLHLKKWNPDKSNRYGLSPIAAGYKLITSANSGLDLRIKQYQNQGVPGILSHADSKAEALTKEQSDRMEAKIKSWFQPKSAYTVPYSDIKLAYTKLGLSAVELAVLEALNADRNAIADLYHFPAHLLNGATSATYNNVGEARKALWSNCIIPLETAFRDGLNNWLGLKYGDAAYIDFDTRHIDELQEDKKTKAEWLTKCTFLTPNEKREAMGYEPLPGGDTLATVATKEPEDAVEEETTNETGEKRRALAA
jgi:HK97 family phage portal protein